MKAVKFVQIEAVPGLDVSRHNTFFKPYIAALDKNGCVWCCDETGRWVKREVFDDTETKG